MGSCFKMQVPLVWMRHYTTQVQSSRCPLGVPLDGRQASVEAKNARGKKVQVQGSEEKEAKHTTYVTSLLRADPPVRYL